MHKRPGRVPPGAVCTGEPVKVQGQDRVGIVELSCGYRAARVSIRENSFIEKYGV